MNEKIKKVLPFVVATVLGVGGAELADFNQSEEIPTPEIEFSETPAKEGTVAEIETIWAYKFYCTCTNEKTVELGGDGLPKYSFSDQYNETFVTVAGLNSPWHFGQEERLEEFDLCENDLKVWDYKLLKVIKRKRPIFVE